MRLNGVCSGFDCPPANKGCSLKITIHRDKQVFVGVTWQCPAARIPFRVSYRWARNQIDIRKTSLLGWRLLRNTFSLKEQKA